MSAVLHLFIVENRERCIFCGKTAVFREGALARVGTQEELLTENGGKCREMWGDSGAICQV